jgi:hypothetical protein
MNLLRAALLSGFVVCAPLSYGPGTQRSLGSARDKAAPLRVPVPVGELFAEGDFFEFADGGARDFGEEEEGGRYNGIGKRPLSGIKLNGVVRRARW